MKKIIILACILLLLTISCSKKTTVNACLKLKEPKREICLKKVASNNNAKVQYELGVMYENGKGVTRDYTQAVDWLTKSAKQGYAPAQYELGLMYYTGYGTLPNYKQTIYWYTEAANQGYADAQFNLGSMYENGKGVVKDYIKALDWYTKAAKQGYIDAQVDLGRIYENGKGVVKNNIKAYAWFSIVVYNNSLGEFCKYKYICSNNYFKYLEYKMSPDDIKQAQDLAQELLKTIKK